MSAGRMRVLVKSSGSCSGGSESESESSSIRACWDMVGGEDEGGGCCGGGNDEWVLGVDGKRVGFGLALTI